MGVVLGTLGMSGVLDRDYMLTSGTIGGRHILRNPHIGFDHRRCIRPGWIALSRSYRFQP